MENAAKDYSTIFDTLALDETMADLGATIRVDSPRSPFDSLPRLALGDGPESHFELGSLLGRGGMGVVHLAHQSALRRDVAIKTVAHEEVTDSDVAVLLQEARVMGMLEHPNVVPVHVIGRDTNDRPMIVMKRIQGTAWLDYITGRAEIDGDAIQFHIDAAVAVCRALAFSHDRGIIHRDIKPENVMIGQFGEVYLMDWGLAVSINDEIRGIPHVSSATSVVGTPAYMPREMTTGQPLDLSAATDVALVGASLYHALTGEPPNRGDTLFDMLRFAYEGRTRAYPDSVPEELVQICERAMAHDGRERYSSVNDMREALEGFLLHRNSFELVDSARERLEALRNAIDEDRTDDVHQAFGEARFGLVSALHIWPENERARRLLDETIRTMIEFELESSNLASSKLLFADLSVADDELLQRIQELEDELSKRDQRLERLAFDYDENVGIRSRRRNVSLLAVFLVVMGAGAVAVGRGPSPDVIAWLHPRVESVYSMAVMFVFVAFVSIYYRLFSSTWRHHKTSRIFARGLYGMALVAALTRSTQVSLDVPLHVALMAESAIYASGLWVLALAIDRRSGGSAFFQFVALFVMPIWPDHAHVIFIICGFFSCIAFIVYDRFRIYDHDPWNPQGDQ